MHDDALPHLHVALHVLSVLRIHSLQLAGGGALREEWAREEGGKAVQRGLQRIRRHLKVVVRLLAGGVRVAGAAML